MVSRRKALSHARDQARNRNQSPQPMMPTWGQPNQVFPMLGKASADVAALASGSFTLQVGAPDGLTDSSDSLTAYALTALSADDMVMLSYCIGEDSGGFWLATGACCESTSQAGCSVCIDAPNTPSTWDVTISGVLSYHTQFPVGSGFDASNVPEADQDAVRDLLNATHTLNSACDASNSCGWCKEITYDNGNFGVTIKLLFTLTNAGVNVANADLQVEITENRGSIIGFHDTLFRQSVSDPLDCTQSIGPLSYANGYTDYGGPPEDDGVFYFPLGTQYTMTNPVV